MTDKNKSFWKQSPYRDANKQNTDNFQNSLSKKVINFWINLQKCFWDLFNFGTPKIVSCLINVDSNIIKINFYKN